LCNQHHVLPVANRVDHDVDVFGQSGLLVVGGQINRDRLVPRRRAAAA